MKLKEKILSYEIGELDQYLWGKGTHYEIYKKLGSHVVSQKGKKGVYFAVWAPNAESVSVVGDFNDWKSNVYQMERLEPMGIFVLFIKGLGVGDCYKYAIKTRDGRELLKADPFAVQGEVRPNTGSVVNNIETLKWSDEDWLKKRRTWNYRESAMSVYEVHPGSWMRHMGYKDDDGFYNYREFADRLVKYVNSMGYTHVELMGIAEHPFDGSWGYQVTGYYAPTSRYGTPQDFAYLINQLHNHEIGVIVDWVPAHFTKDAHGLYQFDGGPLYEYPDPRKGEHKAWGTNVFDYGRMEVTNFLIANALYWIEQFHVDGLRVDAVSSMLYLNYEREDGEWIANKYGGCENLEVIEFLKHLNSIVHERNPGALMIAEESTAWERVTTEVEHGGLGFDLKWNMGWMNDFTEYMKLDPLYRKDNHNKLTFSMMYAYSEHYMLVLSHDEVVHMKGSMLQKMPGLGIDKFRNLMVGYAFMMGHPGKKLLFMGQEFGQGREWSEKRELDWHLLKIDMHKYVHKFTNDLLLLYKNSSTLHATDELENGFYWINANDNYRSIYSFVRQTADGSKGLLFVCNFTPMERADYKVGVPKAGSYKLVLDSSKKKYGGSGKNRKRIYKSNQGECDGQGYNLDYPLEPYGVAVFEF